MMGLSAIFQSKRILTGLCLVGGLIFTTYNIQENSSKIKKISTFETGIQTCFTRVNQTYTAKLLDETSSQYLNQGFQAITEECFAESIASIEENFNTLMPTTLKKLTTMASNVHWFNEDLTTPSSVKSLANGESRDFGTRFEKIEATKDEVLDDVEKFKQEINTDLNEKKNYFYALSTLLITVMLLEYFATTKRKLSNSGSELDAERELMDNDGVESVKLGEIIRIALEQNGLKNCAKLFNNFYVHTTYEKTVRTKFKSSENFTAPVSSTASKTTNNEIASKAVSKDYIDQMWNDDSKAIIIDKKMNIINLDHSLTKIVNHLTDKVFVKGVRLDINVSDKINVLGLEESLEQSIYHVLTFALNNSTAGSGNSVTVNAIKLGDVVAIDIVNTGIGFESEIIRGKAGLKFSDEKLDVDLKVSKALLNDIEGKIQFENKLSQNGDVVGAKIKIILKASEEKTSRLVTLQKGSKKEIMEKMMQDSSII